jgi:hypothetical protein
LRAEGRAGLVIYLTAGDPDPDTSFALFSGLAKPAPTSSRSACRFPIRWPTAPRSGRRAAP